MKEEKEKEVGLIACSRAVRNSYRILAGKLHYRNAEIDGKMERDRKKPEREGVE
jgi:hypothetical protein